jgi:hypothetical protein
MDTYSDRQESQWNVASLRHSAISSWIIDKRCATKSLDRFDHNKNKKQVDFIFLRFVSIDTCVQGINGFIKKGHEKSVFQHVRVRCTWSSSPVTLWWWIDRRWWRRQRRRTEGIFACSCRQDVHHSNSSSIFKWTDADKHCDFSFYSSYLNIEQIDNVYRHAHTRCRVPSVCNKGFFFFFFFFFFLLSLPLDVFVCFSRESKDNNTIFHTSSSMCPNQHKKKRDRRRSKSNQTVFSSWFMTICQ